jgi:NAD(P)-dependent dehydrogenase (short-subunit alcohol dehydrogenase family)
MDMTEKYGRSFAGKVALVTGGSRGIGEGIVRRLASDGAAVAFTYFYSEEKAKRLASEIDAAGGKALPIKADSASPEDIRATVNQVVKELGEIDIFVNNAGILIRGTIDSYSLEDFDRMLAVNVRAAFVGMQAASVHEGWRTDHPDRQQHCRPDSNSGSERLQHDQSGPDRIGARGRYRSRSSDYYGQQYSAWSDGD